MKTSSFVSLIVLFLIFAFLHVFFQTEIIKLGYLTKKNEDRLQQHREDNHILRFNIYALESPHRLDEYVMLKRAELRLMEPMQVVSVTPGQLVSRSASEKTIATVLFDYPAFDLVKRLFVGKQAEAKQ